MSKDMLGSVVRAAVGVPQERLDTLAKIASVMAGDSQRGSDWHERLKQLLTAGLPSETASPAPKPPALLALANDRVAWTAVKNLDPQEYFRTRTGLWVSEEFRTRVLAKASPVALGTAVGKSRDLLQDAYDRDIVAEMGEFPSESEVCARIAQMINRQSNGEEGDLLNDGRANLFYLASCVVDVNRDVDDRLWYVRAWRRDDDCWHAGRRAFSCN